MTDEEVIQLLAERAAGAYINASDQSRRWQLVAQAVLEAVAAKSEIPVGQLLATLAGRPIPLDAPQGTAPVPMSGAAQP